MGLDPLEETYTDCYVVIGDEDVEPLTGAYHHFRGNLPNDGNKIYVCFTHSPGKEPINGFEVREGDMSELQLPPDVEVVDGNLGILGKPKYVVVCSIWPSLQKTVELELMKLGECFCLFFRYLCIRRGMPALSHVEVCYGNGHLMDG